LKAKVFFIAHFVEHSVFLFGLFSTVLDYVANQPIPPAYTEYTAILGALLMGAKYTKVAWQKKIAENSDSAPSKAS
jgi:hypothetical protein